MLRGRLATAVLSLIVVLPLALVGCGGGGSSGSKQATLRVVNATSDVGDMNLSLGGTSRFTALAADALSAAFSFDAGTYDTTLTSGSSSTALLSGNRVYAESTDYTAVAWGSASALKLTSLADTADASNAPASGSAILRVFNATADAGSVDLYLTSDTADLDAATPNVSGLAVGSMTSYATVTPGTYRLRITGTGDRTDIRLDQRGVVVGNQARTTLVLQPGVGGTLVHALQFDYGSTTLTALKNTEARVRVAASVDGNGAVTASLAGSSLNVGLRSPSVGSYVRVPAGTAQVLSLTVAGVPQADSTRSLAAGGDYTLLVSGASASPQATLLTDDNRLPTSTTRSKIRLVHGANGQDALTLAVDYNALATGVAYGSASPFASVASNATATVEVSSPLVAAPLFSTASSTVNLQAQGVYTVFILGGGSAPTGVLRKDR
ncbi:hypothetical protein ISF6_1802 [Piscinibacter sakaiensis]|uniref:DUF4397 domain-containing protein n=1 Tax=Piscinibacter sakaiensis TaxID=1547922 RepID=A0A0K8NZY3_PISS1|nr:hypothetical protein ISF6_1802 [Piscinibacter sakaiensis]